MSTQPHVDPHVSFSATTSPAPAALGRSLEQRGGIIGRPLLQLRFGSRVAALSVTDVWSACCELLLAADLVRERKLDRFVLDVEPVFQIEYARDSILCVFSPEHVFPVRTEEFAAGLEQVVDEILAGTSCPRVMHVAASWGASEIRALPYSARFSDSLLT
jgi:hypothetical protein